MEKAILVGVQLPKTKTSDVQNSLGELSRLIETAGARPAHLIIQRRHTIDPAYFIGEGKADELRDLVEKNDIRTVVFDDELRPVQQRNLEERIGAKIIDRTRLILDIFARRARTREGILQVERAQLAYYMPRLTKKGLWLDSQVGGIGTRRGPGERKLEIDQRRIRERIAQLDREIEHIRRHRAVISRQRAESGTPVIAIVGYTNAGKSTLLNRITESRAVYADDKLFATLDPTTRQVRLPGGRIALFTDTVGFINKLPHALVAAFRATLEEITRANCILHVIDAAHPDYPKQILVVMRVLKELNAENIPILPAYNKADVLTPEHRRRLEREHALLISAKTGEGIEELLRRVGAVVTPALEPHQIIVPYRRITSLARIFKVAVVKKQEYTERGIRVSLEATPGQWVQIQHLVHGTSETAGARH